MKTSRHREVRSLGRNHTAKTVAESRKGMGVLATLLTTLLCEIHLRTLASSPVSGDRDITTKVRRVDSDEHFSSPNPRSVAMFGRVVTEAPDPVVIMSFTPTGHPHFLGMLPPGPTLHGAFACPYPV